MIQITPQMRILVAVAAVDFRKGIDGLAALCRQQLQADPFCGALFVFRNRRPRRSNSYATMVKDTGFVRSACPREALVGGPRVRNGCRRWRRVSCRCWCGMAIPRGSPARRCGAAWGRRDKKVEENRQFALAFHHAGLLR